MFSDISVGKLLVTLAAIQNAKLVQAKHQQRQLTQFRKIELSLKKINLHTLLFLPLILSAVLLNSCHIYSFTGASIPSTAKTFTVKYFPNQAQKVNPSMSQAFTEALKDKLSKETNLRLIDKEGDLEFSGAITDYTITAIGRQGNQAAANQLSISVKVDFVNRKKEHDEWSSTFTKTATFDATQSLAAVESDLVTQINKLLVDEIFNKAVVNW